jgi:hypothetical protein
VPERSGGLTDPFPVYRYRDGTGRCPSPSSGGASSCPWAPISGRTGSSTFSSGASSASSGSRAACAASPSTGDAIGQEQTLFETLPRTHDNLEGISVWRDADGFIRLTMISDDNGRAPLQRTEFVEYRVLP